MGKAWINLLCLVTGLFLCPLVIMLAGIKELVDGISISIKKNQWLKGALSARVQIVDRKEERNGYAESRREVWNCELAIQIPDNIANEPNEKIMWIRVSERIYDKYRQKETTRIYYSAAQPDILLLKVSDVRSMNRQRWLTFWKSGRRFSHPVSRSTATATTIDIEGDTETSGPVFDCYGLYLPGPPMYRGLFVFRGDITMAQVTPMETVGAVDTIRPR